MNTRDPRCRLLCMLRQNPGLNLSRDAQSRSAMCSPSTAPAHHGARLCAIQVRQAPAQHSACPSQRPSTTALAHHTPSWRSGRGLPLGVGEGRHPGRDAHLRVKETQGGPPLALSVRRSLRRREIDRLHLNHPRSSELIRAHPRQSGHTCGVARSTVSTLIIVSLLSAASLLRVMYLKKEAASVAISRHQPSSAVVTGKLRISGHQKYPSVP